MENQDQLPFELAFKGTPAEFGVCARMVFSQASISKASVVFDVLPGSSSGNRFGKYYTRDRVHKVPGYRDPDPDSNLVTLFFWTPKTWPFKCAVVAHTVPGGSTLRVSTDPQAWPNLERWWELLRAELEQQGWFERPIISGENSGVEESKQSEPLQTEPTPIWERIPDKGWNRDAVKLWCKGYLAKDIADKVGATQRTVYNRISALRKDYPEILLNQQRGKKRKPKNQ